MASLEIAEQILTNRKTSGTTASLEKSSRRFLSLMGFTLLELLVVVLIISVTLGLTTPIFRKTFSNIQLTSTGSEMVSLMRYAHERAIVEKIILRLNLAKDGTSFWLTKKITDEEVFDKLDGKFGREFILPKDLKIESKVDSLDFYPDGEIDESIIEITNIDKKTITVITKTNGKISIEEEK